MDEERVARVSQHMMQTEVGPAVVRAVNAKAADAASMLERADQIAAPRRPSVEVAGLKSDVNEMIARQGSARRASIEMDKEQVARVQEHLFKAEVGPSLVRSVNAKVADAAAELEQQQRVSQHMMQTEVGPAVVRAVNAKAADAASMLEHADQIAAPRRPSVEVAKMKGLVNAAIDGAVVVEQSG